MRQNGMRTGPGGSISDKQTLALVNMITSEEFHEASEGLRVLA
jgi:hypothetical protein